MPLGTRIRTRLVQEPKNRGELVEILTESVRKAGNPNLLSKGLVNTLADHAIGNLRTMMNMAAELLEEGLRRELNQLDEKLFVGMYSRTKKPKPKNGRPK